MENQTISTHEPSSNEIYRDIDLNRRFCKAEVNGKIMTLLTKDNLSLLGSIETFVDKIIDSSDLGYKKEIKTSFNYQPRIHFTSLGLYRYFIQINSFITTVYDHDIFYIYSPNVKLFYDSCNEMNLHLRKFEQPYLYFSDIEKYHAEVFNDLIELIRSKSKTLEFKQKLRNREINSERMHSSIVDYIQGLFDFCASLVVIRVDLAYLSVVDDSGELKGQGISLKQACMDRDRLISNMKHNKIFKYKIGFVWKIEYTKFKGYHFHWMFFFRGAKVKSSVDKSFRIGEYWRDVITKGKGIFFSCNAKMNQYRFLGIGRIHASLPADAHLRDNLNNCVVKYLTKRDQFLRVKLREKQRIFGTGEVPLKSNAGRPRHSYEDEAEVLLDNLLDDQLKSA